MCSTCSVSCIIKNSLLYDIIWLTYACTCTYTIKIHNKNVAWRYYWCMELLCIQVSSCIFNFMFLVNQLSTCMLIFVIFFPAVPACPRTWGNGANSAFLAGEWEGGATHKERQNLSRHVLTLEAKDLGQAVDQVSWLLIRDTLNLARFWFCDKLNACTPMALRIQIAKFKFHQYQLS